MKWQRIFLALLGLSLLLSAPAKAEKVSSIFTAELPVISQREDVRMTAFRQGFEEVLLRLTGNPEVDKQPAIQGVLDQVSTFVQSYHYLPGKNPTSFQIQVRYDKEDIENLLRKANIPYWGEVRPSIFVWLVKSDRHQDQIISSDEANALTHELMSQSKRYGLPLLFPLMDMQDLHAVTPKDVINNKLSVLREAAKRYSYDALLIGKINEVGGESVTHWKLIFADKSWKWNFRNEKPDMLAALLLNQMSYTLSRQMMTQDADPKETEIHVRVTNINEPDDFKRVTEFFKSISSVRRVQLEQVVGDEIEFSLQVQGEMATFRENVLIGNRLNLKAENDMTNSLVYEWNS